MTPLVHIFIAWATMSRCLTGPGTPITDCCCVRFDLNADQRFDLYDVAQAMVEWSR